ncbi:MAG: helix-turn-helix domain-containing protein [bacterium]|nr:helix-turn-helix domain-containing protein [bacterium]
MKPETLQKIGLTPGESKIYIALLGLGQSTTGPIVTKSGVTTSKSYKILARLEEKGLVSHVYKNKVKHFKAASPEKVLDMVTDQFNEVKKRRTEIEKLIPQLVAYQKQVEEEHEAEIYYGYAGLVTLFDQQLRELEKGESHYVIGITHFEDYGKDVAEYFRILQVRRDKKGIVSNFLLGENARGSFGYMKKSRFSNLRYLPYASLVAINVHKNTTIIGVFIGKPILFKIKSQLVADNFIHYFKLLWKQAKK